MQTNCVHPPSCVCLLHISRGNLLHNRTSLMAQSREGVTCVHNRCRVLVTYHLLLPNGAGGYTVAEKSSHSRWTLCRIIRF